MITEFNRYEGLYHLNEWIVSNKGIDKKAAKIMVKCFTIIMTNWGFFADLLFNLRVLENTKVPTMGTDGRSIVYNPKFVHELTEQECTFVILHEILHNTLFHFDRVGARDKKVWNEAADYVINFMLEDMRKSTALIKMPDKGLLDNRFGGMAAEQVYDILMKEGRGKGQGDGGGGGPKGPGSPGGPGQLTPDDIFEPGSLGGDDTFVDANGNPAEEGNPGLATTDADAMKKMWGDLRREAALKNPGSMPGALDRLLSSFNKPKINWKVELKRFVANIYNKLKYTPLNRRHIWKKEYLPGIRKAGRGDYKDVVIAIDTSGSIGERTLTAFASELKGIFDLYGIVGCHVIWCDCEVQSVQSFDVAQGFDIGKKLRPAGGGGTSFIPPFVWVNKNLIQAGKNPAFFIYFTDAYGEAPSSSLAKGYHDRVLWVVTDNQNPFNTLKFGKILLLDSVE